MTRRERADRIAYAYFWLRWYVTNSGIDVCDCMGEGLYVWGKDRPDTIVLKPQRLEAMLAVLAHEAGHAGQLIKGKAGLEYKRAPCHDQHIADLRGKSCVRSLGCNPRWLVW